ncbi:hypothetical protein [Streptomyces brasiliensis]|nr:hypothetical protein [Streptomyces brasiliensis]
MPSAPIATPGLAATNAGEIETASMADFCEAALRLLASPVDTTTGRIAYSEDVLHPELGARGWLGGV